MISLEVNGEMRRLEVDPQTPLLWVLREELGLCGTKYSCGVGECGACTVHLDGEAVQACVTTAAEAEGRRVTTIEGLQGPLAERLKQAWLEEDVPQCGYCQPGQIMTAAALLARNPRPAEAEIEAAMSGVLCRCGTYQQIRRVIGRVAGGSGHGR